MSRLDWNRDGRDWPQRQASSFVDAAGLHWHVQREGQGPVLLLLHGTGSATHSWRGLWPLLTPFFTLVAPDLPGHGFTSTPPSMSLPALSASVAGLLESLDLAPAMIVGHSAGAAVALRMALDGRVEPALLAGIGAALLPFPGAAAALFPAMAKALFLNPLVPRLFTMTAAIGGEPARFLARSTGSRIDSAGASLYGRLFRSDAHVTNTLAMMAAWDLVPLSRDLARLGPPLLLLHGDADAAVPVKAAADVAARVPNGTALLLSGLGHLPHEEAPATVAAHLLEAANLAGLIPAAPARQHA